MARYGRGYRSGGGFFSRLVLRLLILAFALLGLMCLVTNSAPGAAISHTAISVQHLFNTH